MKDFLDKLSKLHPLIRVLVVAGVGLSLLLGLFELEGGMLSLERPPMSIQQENLGWFFLAWASFSIFLVAYRGLTGDFSEAASGKYTMNLGYEETEILRIANELQVDANLRGHEILLPTPDQKPRWKAILDTELDLLDEYFESYGVKEFYKRVQFLRTSMTLYLDAEKLPTRKHAYRLSGVGELVDEVGDTKVASRIRVSRTDPCNIVRVRTLREALLTLRVGKPILVAIQQQLKLLGDDKEARFWLYYRSKFSIVEWRWKLSPGLIFVTGDTGRWAAISYADDLARV